MPSTTRTDRESPRHLLFLTTPSLWECWPLLPLVRRKSGREDECGLLCDVLGLKGTPGFSATVVFCNLFQTPALLDDFLALPKEVFDTPEEVVRRLTAQSIPA